MPHTAPHNAGAPPTPSVVILGNDAVLAARPATAVQLAHACHALGYDAAVPASWGDELVAGEAVRQIRARGGDGATILCACPYVEARLLAPGPDLAPLLVGVVSPPIAVARYLRRLYGGRPVHITYVGACPSASADAASADPAIDVALAPGALLRSFVEHGVRLAEQPVVYDSVIPPDRRRFCSLPGGAPAPSCLWDGEQGALTLVEIAGEDYRAELAQHLLSERRAVVDLAPRLGCACSGATAAAPHSNARTVVATTEPPRANGPVVEPPPGLELQREISERRPPLVPITPPSSMPAIAAAAEPPRPAAKTPPRSPVVRADAPPPPAPPTPAAAPGVAPPNAAGRATPPEGGAAIAPNRKKATPSGIFRAYTGQVPTTRSAEGKPVPRAYAAHRKQTPSGGVAAQRPAGEPGAPPDAAGPPDVSRAPEAPRAPDETRLPDETRAPVAASATMPPRRSAFAFLTADAADETTVTTPSDASEPAAPASGAQQQPPQQSPPSVLPVLAPAARRVPAVPAKAPIDVRPRPAESTLDAARLRRRRALTLAAASGAVLVLGAVATAVGVRGGNQGTAATGAAGGASSSSAPPAPNDAAATAAVATPEPALPNADSAHDSTAATDSSQPSAAPTSDATPILAPPPAARESAAAGRRTGHAGAGASRRAADSAAAAAAAAAARAKKKEPRGLARLLGGATIFPTRGTRPIPRTSAPAPAAAPPAAAAAPASSTATAAERAAIEREITQRRARIDSIARRLDSLRAIKPPTPPKRR